MPKYGLQGQRRAAGRHSDTDDQRRRVTAEKHESASRSSNQPTTEVHRVINTTSARLHKRHHPQHDIKVFRPSPLQNFFRQMELASA
jgi:hypothetical protein